MDLLHTPALRQLLQRKKGYDPNSLHPVTKPQAPLLASQEPMTSTYTNDETPQPVSTTFQVRPRRGA